MKKRVKVDVATNRQAAAAFTGSMVAWCDHPDVQVFFMCIFSHFHFESLMLSCFMSQLRRSRAALMMTMFQFRLVIAVAINWFEKSFHFAFIIALNS
jgi:hypothetical protein